jgi:hypothetical protein
MLFKKRMKENMFEHYKEPILSQKEFIRRFIRHFCIGFGLIIIALGIGAIGYHFTENLSWLDSFLNASMILTGMGPVNQMQTDAGKIFATVYALFSGVAFLTMAAILFAPVLHRFLHKFHLEFDETDTKD